MTVKEKLKKGEKVSGVMIRIVRNPALAYLAENGGLDFVMYDCEHSDYNMESLHDLFLMGNALGLASLVRVPNGTKEWISRVMDQGASGVMVPMIETKEQAENLVFYSKYQPVGGRGFSGGIAHCNYKGGKHAEIMKAANDKVIAIAQIETKKAVENIEEIAAVPGLDALLIGPNDLSVSLGIPGDLMNPMELEAIAKVAWACKKQGKNFGLHAGEGMIKKFAQDLTLVMCGTDTDIISQGLKQTAEMIKAL